MAWIKTIPGSARIQIASSSPQIDYMRFIDIRRSFYTEYAVLTKTFLFQIVHMAHALRRISYATCDPENALFSFLAREPRGHFSLQYCHSFITRTPEQVRIAHDHFTVSRVCTLVNWPIFYDNSVSSDIFVLCNS